MLLSEDIFEIISKYMGSEGGSKMGEGCKTLSNVCEVFRSRNTRDDAPICARSRLSELASAPDKTSADFTAGMARYIPRAPFGNRRTH